ncbi:MAG: ABC transporter ATP-binding protein [Desulfobacterales bacterium]|nr:ABC transporter ATP-binding protein [Desulfobacterales bacterium]
MNLLDLRNVSKLFGRMAALSDITCGVKENDLLAVIGPNGAGKTTFFNVITGKFKPTEGEVLFKEERISGLPPHKIVQKGISRSFQIVNLYPDLTVFENVRIGVLAHNRLDLSLFKAVGRIGKVNDEVNRILDLVHLKDKAGNVATNLSHGDQKCLEMGIALTRHPQLLLLDEPTAGMSPEETGQTVELIRDVWQKTGTTIIFTEHDLNVVFSISTRIMVLQLGQLIAEGGPKEIRANEKVRKAYLGEE